MIRAICLLVLAEASWLRDLWDAQGFDGSQSLSWPAAVSFERLLDEFVPAAERDHFAVNIGGQDGKSHDPVYPLFASRGYRGVVFEAFPPPALFSPLRPEERAASRIYDTPTRHTTHIVYPFI